MGIRAGIIIFALACLGALSGCAGLPQNAPGEAAAGAGLVLVHQDSSVRLYAKPGFNPARFGGYALEHVEVQPSAPEHKAEQERLGAELAAQLAGLFAPGQFAPGQVAPRLHLDIRLYDIKPVSPALNALTLVLAFAPLDTGAMIVDTIYRDDAGSIQAHRIEQLTGSIFNIKASFSAYGQHKIMLSEWAQRCGASAACLAEGKEGQPAIALH